MKTQKDSGKLVAQLRKIIGKSQSQFAAMVGVSKHTIISVENGRNKLTAKLARRIQVATGARILDKHFEFASVSGIPAALEPHKVTPAQRRYFHRRYDGTGKYDHTYTHEDFEQWRATFYPCSDETARKHFDKIKKWIEFLFRAAVKPGVVGNRDRLPAVHQSLVDWLNETRETFKLENEIEELLEEEARSIGELWLSIPPLLEDPKKARAHLAAYGFDYDQVKKLLKKRKPFDWLVLETELRHEWDPFDETLSCPCKIRKLAPIPKFRLEDWRISFKRFYGPDYNCNIDEQVREIDRLRELDRRD